MTYQFKWHPNTYKILEKLPKNIIKRIVDKLDIVTEDPIRYVEHFEGNLYKIRVGDYRALVDIDFNNKLILVKVFGHRSNVYKRLK